MPDLIITRKKEDRVEEPLVAKICYAHSHWKSHTKVGIVTLRLKLDAVEVEVIARLPPALFVLKVQLITGQDCWRVTL